MILALLTLQVVSQTFTGEFVIQDAELREANFSLPIQHSAEEVHQWSMFTSGNWYALENDCLRRSDNGLVCQNKQRESNEK